MLPNNVGPSPREAPLDALPQILSTFDVLQTLSALSRSLGANTTDQGRWKVDRGVVN